MYPVNHDQSRKRCFRKAHADQMAHFAAERRSQIHFKRCQGQIPACNGCLKTCHGTLLTAFGRPQLPNRVTSGKRV